LYLTRTRDCDSWVGDVPCVTLANGSFSVGRMLPLGQKREKAYEIDQTTATSNLEIFHTMCHFIAASTPSRSSLLLASNRSGERLVRCTLRRLKCSVDCEFVWILVRLR
jgi:hypothetical protein